jgi:hypothetical protein
LIIPPQRSSVYDFSLISAILILNRSSFAEGLLTEAERARFGSKPRPSPIRANLSHNENCWSHLGETPAEARI